MKRVFILLVAMVFFIGGAWTLPGFTPEIPNSSGEFVWYRDETFSRPSYVGFLIYDDNTYQMRYCAPENKKKKLPPLEVAIYVTIDPEKDHVEFTGERIISARTKDDGVIINYMHDLFYEFSKERALLGAINREKKAFCDLEIFGGTVDIFFDSLVPIFNLRYIEDNKGKRPLSLVTAGRLLSSDDKVFDNFSGLKIPTDTKHSFSPSKKAEAFDFNTGIQSITLDSQWSAIAENSFACGDVANVTCAEGAGRVELPLIRRLLLSTGTSFKDWEHTKVDYADGCTIRTYVYDSDSTGVMVSMTNLVGVGGEDSFCYFSMSVYRDVYERNKKYFDVVKGSYFIASF